MTAYETFVKQLAVNGGTPVRAKMLPYGRQTVSDEDVAAVVDVLRSDWLTTGPMVPRFEQALAQVAGTSQAVAVANGTAALHCAMHAVGIGPGDEVIVPTMTFAATANAVRYCGGTPVFADVDGETLLVDPEDVARLVTSRTKAIVGVDYGGQPAPADALAAIAGERGLRLVSDACHALGATDGGRPAGSLADVSTFSFHPVKPITTGEGGAITTNDPALADRMRIFRNHGITSDHRQREKTGSYFYEQVELGYNYRLNDLQCALGLSQVARVEAFTARRNAIAARYDAAFAAEGLSAFVRPLRRRAGTTHAFHLYVVRLELDALRVDRAEVHRALRAEGIAANVHYVPVHLHPYYRHQGTHEGQCPVAEAVWQQILTLPIFPTMTDNDVDGVMVALLKVVSAYKK
jgi:perosamine synthetase